MPKAMGRNLKLNRTQAKNLLKSMDVHQEKPLTGELGRAVREELANKRKRVLDAQVIPNEVHSMSTASAKRIVDMRRDLAKELNLPAPEFERMERKIFFELSKTPPIRISEAHRLEDIVSNSKALKEMLLKFKDVEKVRNAKIDARISDYKIALFERIRIQILAKNYFEFRVIK